MSSGSLSIDDRTAILIKAYELEPLPKLALEIGENATRDILHSGQLLGHYLRVRSLHWIGIDREVQLVDNETAKAIRDDPVYGFSHYIVDHGVANVFGKQLFEGKMPLEPAIGAASAIGIVEKDRMTGKTSVFTKKQLGIDSKSARDIAKKFHSGTMEETKLSEIRDVDNKDKPIKENYELAREQILKRKAEEEKKMLREEDMEPNWIKNDMEILIQQERRIEYTPELKDNMESGMPLWANKSKIIDLEKTEDIEEDDMDEDETDETEDELEETEEELPYEEQDEDEGMLMPVDVRKNDDMDKDYILPFDIKKKDREEDEDDDVRLPF